MRRALLLIALLFLSGVSAAKAAAVDHAPGVAMHGEAKYKPGFAHLDYVNPDAPKGGTVVLSSIGGFDSTNNFILIGEQAAGLGMVYQTLMEPTADEPNSSYGAVAETISFPDDRSWVTFTLRKEAKFNDGTPVTAEDVIWSFDTLKTKGHPFYRSYYGDVTKVEKTGEHEVKFSFKTTGNMELPLIMGQLPVIPKHDWVKRDFTKTTLDKVVGSGPYEIESVDPGRSISFKRVQNWWGEKLPLNVGRYNFDHIRYDYYRDATVAQEALLSGKYDLKVENFAKAWATAYETDAVKNGQLKKEELKNGNPSGMQAFAYNIRRPLFQNPKVREALAYAFDFEWSNKNFAYGLYTRTRSYFDNSELAAAGMPSADELKVLEPYRAQLPERVFTQEYNPPKTDGSGNIRANMGKAMELLKEAGWTLKGTELVDANGKPFTFEILIDSPMFERWIQPFLRNLERMGIRAQIRVVDTAQYQNRLNDFDFDMIVQVFGQSNSPGNEQRDFWQSDRADIRGAKNIIGIKNPAVDAIIEQLIHAKERTELVTLTRALDRVLQWNFYVIPQWHIATYRVAYWDVFGRPPVNPPYGLPVESVWWIDPAKQAKIRPGK